MILLFHAGTTTPDTTTPLCKVSDEDMKSFMTDYLIEGIPHMIIINKEGIIVYAGSALRAEKGQLQELLDEKLK